MKTTLIKMNENTLKDSRALGVFPKGKIFLSPEGDVFVEKKLKKVSR